MAQPSFANSRRLRAGRRSVPGQLYLVTTVTNRRHPRFLDTEVARLAAAIFARRELWAPSRCLAWVLMPDHWHGLLELGEGAGLSSTMQRIKGVTSHSIRQLHAVDGPLWAKGFHDHALRSDESHDHALRSDESVERAARYVIANPVRAGLVKDPMDYPYWDAYFIDGDSGEWLF